MRKHRKTSETQHLLAVGTPLTGDDDGNERQSSFRKQEMTDVQGKARFSRLNFFTWLWSCSNSQVLDECDDLGSDSQDENESKIDFFQLVSTLR
jgi:hypothetical protein